MKTFTVLIAFTLFIVANSFTQPVIIAQKTIGGAMDDGLSRIYITKDGGLIAGGTSNSDSDYIKSENSRGGYDYWVVKLSSNRQVEWNKTFGGTADDYLASVQQTLDGGYIVGGFSSSGISGEKSDTSRGGADYWIIKLDNEGNKQWDKTYGGNADDDLIDLKQTTDGGYLLGGTSYSKKSGDKSEKSRGFADYWIVKLDSLGNKQWDKTFGGNYIEEFAAVEQASNGYIAGGTSFSDKSGDKSEDSRAGSADYWIVKLDVHGNKQWDKTIGGNGDDNLATLEKTGNGGYVLGGSSLSNISAEKSDSNRGGFDYWIVKLDKEGNEQWDKTIGGNNIDDLTSLQQTTDGGYISGGYSWSNISAEKTENSRGYNDYWIVKLDRQGNKQWDKTIGGNRPDFGKSIKEISKNKYVVGGGSSSAITGDKTQGSRNNDYWIVYVNYLPNGFIADKENTNLIENKSHFAKGFIAYPAPAKNVLYVESTEKAMYTLTNSTGKIVLAQIVNGNATVNVNQLPAGFYYLKNINTGIVQKIILIK